MSTSREYLGLPVLVTVMGLASAAQAAAPEVACDGTQATEADQCLGRFFTRVQQDSNATLRLTELQCQADAQGKLEHTAKVGETEVEGAFEVTCDKGDFVLTLHPEKLRAFKQQALTLEIGTFKAVAKVVDFKKPAPAEEEPDTAGTPPQKLPIDIAPELPSWANSSCDQADRPSFARMAPHVVIVHENLAVDRCSVAHVTETDRVVIRLVARNLTRCRYSVTADAGNKNEPELARIGGLEAFTDMLTKLKLTSLEDETGESCGYAIKKQQGRWIAVDQKQQAEAEAHGFVDFSFGPYTTEALKFQVVRKDREFRTADLEGTVSVANHLRYAGWVDLVAVAAQSGRVDPVVRVDNGSELQRVHEVEPGAEIDYIAAFKVFALCNGTGNGWFKSQDMIEADVCVGVGAGFSLRHLTSRFYPIGLNLTFQKYFSVHGMLMLDQGKELTSGLSEGSLFSGTTDDLPTRDRLYPGVAVGVGFDPSLVGALIGSIVKSGL